MKLLNLTMAMVQTALAHRQFPAITVMENGVAQTKYVVGVGKPSDVANSTQVVCPHNSQTYLANNEGKGTNHWDTVLTGDMFYKPNLLGGSFEYDIDLSQSTCGCLATVYFTGMPGIDTSGKPDPRSNVSYYCAGQDTTQPCPEIDVMEANQHAWQTTLHQCDENATVKGHYDGCDSWGFDKKIWEMDKNAYGPGEQFTINTQNDFHTKFEYKADNGKLVQVVTTLSQGDKSFVITQDDTDPNHAGYTDYLERMQSHIESGMTLVFSNWGTNVHWLDKETGCTEACNDPIMYVNNLKFTTAPQTQEDMQIIQ